MGPRPQLAEINRRRSVQFRQARAVLSTKPCRKCGTAKSPAAFGKNKKTYDGLQTWCKDCQHLHNRLFVRRILVELRAAVFEKLGHICKRCSFPDKRALQIDHVHGNGREDSGRGPVFYKKVLADTVGRFQILCANCNWIKRHENQELPPRLDGSRNA